MSYYINPEPSLWSKQLEEFTIDIRAWDDNGQPVRDRALELQYYMSYDGSVPDPINTQRSFANASGLLEFTLNVPCRITAYLIYPADVDDPTSEKHRELLCENEIVYFQPFFVDIQLEYTGPDVPIDSDFNPKYVLVKGLQNNGTFATIPYNKLTFFDKTITQMGDNVFDVKYADELLNTVWDLNLTVTGTYKIVRIRAIYIGEFKLENEEVLKSEIKVYVTRYDGYNEFEEEAPEDQWSFTSMPFPNKDNNGIIKLEWNDRPTQVQVAYEPTTQNWKLDVWYEGPDIPVDEYYDIEDLRIRLIYENKNCVILEPYKVQISDHKVHTIGWNWYKVSYRITNVLVLHEWFAVYGYVPYEHEPEEFKVIYLTGNDVTPKLTDVTDIYKQELGSPYKDSKSPVTINWDKFRLIAVRHRHFGRLKVNVPKFSGLSDHTATQWIVFIYKDNWNTINALFVKSFNEENGHGYKKEELRGKPHRCD